MGKLIQSLTKKGKHRAFPLLFRPVWKIKRLRYRVMFSSGCRYDLGYPDQLDWNKLFGVYFFPGIHKSSARCVWRYNADLGKIELALYIYDKGERKMIELSMVDPFRHVEIELAIHERNASLTIDYGITGPACAVGDSFLSGWRWIGFLTNTFFGGNRPAPHDVRISLKRLF